MAESCQDAVGRTDAPLPLGDVIGGTVALTPEEEEIAFEAMIERRAEYFPGHASASQNQMTFDGEARVEDRE